MNSILRSCHRAWCGGIVLTVLASSFGLAADPHPSLPPIGSLEGLGVNIHFTDPQPGEMEMIAAAGFKWVRMDFTWAGTEREKGIYEFSAYDRLVAHLDKHKLRALFILDYGNKLYDPDGASPHTDESRAAFGRWAAAAVAHFKGKGYIWELWNEPNIAQFWKLKPNVDDYVALAKATASALRDARLIPGRDGSPSRPPDAPVTNGSAKNKSTADGSESRPYLGECFIGPATSTIDLTFLEACFKAGLLDVWNAVSVHPYRQTAPETVEEEYRSVRVLIRKYAPKDKAIPIISSEWGYSTSYPAFAGKTDSEREEMQAKYLARMFLTNISNDVPLSIWYDWRDDGPDPKEPEHHFGLVRHEYRAEKDPVFEPKPAYQAVKTLTKELMGFQFSKELTESVADGPFYRLDNPLFLFARNNDTRLSTWRGGDGDEVVRVWASPGAFIVTSFVGSTRTLDTTAPFPLFLTAQDGVQYVAPTKPNPLLQVAAGWKRLPLEYAEHAPARVTINDVVKNPLDRSVELPGWLNPDEVDRASIALRAPVIFSEKEVKEHVEAARTKGRQTVEARASAERRILRGIGRIALQQRFGLRFDVEGDGVTATYYQHSFAIPTNPMLIQLLPPSPGSLPVHVTNVGGEAISGRVEAWQDHDDYTVTTATGGFRFETGEVEKFIELRPAKDVDGWNCNRLGFEGAGTMIPQLVASIGRVRVETWTAIVGGAAGSVEAAKLSLVKPADAPPLTPSLQLQFRFNRGWGFIRLVPSDLDPSSDTEKKLLAGATAMGLWIRGDATGCQARIRFIDATGQTFQTDGPKIDWTGWRCATFPMRSTEEKPLAHWGGSNDGVIHYPIKWDSIFLLDNISRQPVEGEIYLSAPTLIY